MQMRLSQESEELMYKKPCVIYTKFDGTEEHIIHGTAMRAERNAAMVGQVFHWHEFESWYDKLKKRYVHTG